MLRGIRLVAICALASASLGRHCCAWTPACIHGAGDGVATAYMRVADGAAAYTNEHGAPQKPSSDTCVQLRREAPRRKLQPRLVFRDARKLQPDLLLERQAQTIRKQVSVDAPVFQQAHGLWPIHYSCQVGVMAAPQKMQGCSQSNFLAQTRAARAWVQACLCLGVRCQKTLSLLGWKSCQRMASQGKQVMAGSRDSHKPRPTVAALPASVAGWPRRLVPTPTKSHHRMAALCKKWRSPGWSWGACRKSLQPNLLERHVMAKESAIRKQVSVNASLFGKAGILWLLSSLEAGVNSGTKEPCHPGEAAAVQSCHSFAALGFGAFRKL